jgi:hypothetical protein
MLHREGEARDPRAVQEVQGKEVRLAGSAHKDVRGLRDRVPEPRQARASVRPLPRLPMTKDAAILAVMWVFVGTIILLVVGLLVPEIIKTWVNIHEWYFKNWSKK